jgi:hypothetical protein
LIFFVIFKCNFILFSQKSWTQLFADIGWLVGGKQWKTSREPLALSPPGVEMYCVHGVGQPTTDRLHWRAGDTGQWSGIQEANLMANIFRYFKLIKDKFNQRKYLKYYLPFFSLEKLNIFSTAFFCISSRLLFPFSQTTRWRWQMSVTVTGS